MTKKEKAKVSPDCLVIEKAVVCGETAKKIKAMQLQYFEKTGKYFSYGRAIDRLIAKVA